MEEVNSLMTMNIQPLGLLCLRIDNNPQRNYSLTSPSAIRIVHELVTSPGMLLPHLAFKNALLKPIGASGF